MKDKRKKYNLSYFIKNGGKSIDTSPSVNASEMNEDEIKRRNNNLNRELREMENPEEENAINNSFVNQERNNAAQPANQVNNSNNDNNENKGNSREPFTEPKNEEEVVAEDSSREPEPEINVVIPASEESSREAQINAEIKESETRLAELIRQFSLEPHRNRPEFDGTLANINATGAAAMNQAFEVNNERRAAQEEAKLKKERDARRREKEEGVEANTAIERRKPERQSTSEKTPSLKNRANRFFRLIATSRRRPSDLSSNDLYQFSQNLLNYIEWARINLLTKEQRSEFANLRPEQLLTRLPRNLQILFERIRSERNRLISLETLRSRPDTLRLRPYSAPVLPDSAPVLPDSAPVLPASALVLPATKRPQAPQEPSVYAPPIMVSHLGSTLDGPPNGPSREFNVNKSQIKQEDKEKTKPSSIKIKKMSPENRQKKINENAKKLSNQANMSKELHTQKILRNRNKFITEISEKLEENKFLNWYKSDYIKFQLSELQDETDTKKIIEIIQELEFLLKEREKEKRIPVNLNKEKVVVKVLKAIENKRFNDEDLEKIIELIDELGTLNKIENKDRVNEILEKLQYSINSYKPSKNQLELEKIQLNKIYKSKAQFISKIKNKLEKYKFKNRKGEIEELIQKIDSLKEENSSQIPELMRKLTEIIDEEEKKITNEWLKKTSRLMELSKNGPIRLKSLTISELKKKIKETPKDQKEEIEQLTSMISKIEKEEEEQQKKLKKEQDETNKAIFNYAVSNQYKNSKNILVEARKEKEKRNQEKEKEKEEKERIEKNEILRKELEKKKLRKNKQTKRVLEKGKIIEEQGKQTQIKEQLKATKDQIKEKEETYEKLKRKENNKTIKKKDKDKLIKITDQLTTLAKQKTSLEQKIIASVALIEQLRQQREIDPQKQLEERNQKHGEIIRQVVEKHKQMLEAETKNKKSALVDEIKNLFKEIENNAENSPVYLSNVKNELLKEFDRLTQEKHSKIIEELFKIHQQILESKNSTEKLQLTDKRKKLFQEIQNNSQNNHKYLKDVREAITKGFKELNYKYVENEFKSLFTLTEEMINTNNNNKKIELKKEIKEIMAKLKAARDIDEQNRKKFLNKYTNFVNSKEIESRAKKGLKIIENSKKVIQDKHIESSEEKNLFKRYLKNSLSLVDDKNKAELEKLYKKLNTEEIKIFPKTKKKYQELIQKYKNIEKTKLDKKNRNTNELATPNIKPVQKFKPKPEISPWAKKDSKKDSKNLTKPVKSTKRISQTFPKDSGKVINGVSYKKKVKSTEKPVQNISPKENISSKAIQDKHDASSEEKNLFKRYLKNSLSLVDDKNKAKLEKLNKKLNTEEIKIFPKTKKKFEELIKKYKNIEKSKLDKTNRTTKELATPNIKPVQKFPKDSGKVINGVSFKNKVKSTEKPV
jgi:hypothetical protein